MLVVVGLVVAACIAVNLLIPPRPVWMQSIEARGRRFLADRSPDRASALDQPDAGQDLVPDVVPDAGLFTAEFVQQRLDQLAAELRRLDEIDAGSVFALGFRTHVVQDAYRALQDDASRLAEVPSFALGEVALDDDAWAPHGPAEELEL